MVKWNFLKKLDANALSLLQNATLIEQHLHTIEVHQHLHTIEVHLCRT